MNLVTKVLVGGRLQIIVQCIVWGWGKESEDEGCSFSFFFFFYVQHVWFFTLPLKMKMMDIMKAGWNTLIKYKQLNMLQTCRSYTEIIYKDTYTYMVTVMMRK